MKLTSSPWGHPQVQKEIAIGIIELSTPGHGGVYLSPARWKEFRSVLPAFQSWAGDQWLEEDCDWAAAVAVWPELYSDQCCYNARRSLAERDKKGELNGYEKAIDRKREFHRKANAYEATIAGKWECGSMCTVYPKPGWGVSMTRGTDRKCVYFAKHPAKQYYTDEELATVGEEATPVLA